MSLIISDMIFSEKILDWYGAHKRDLPWRSTREPYKIWLSEIILQQTRVVQGIPYYNRFVQNFPTIQDLASATEEEVLKLWQGLGYYSRARNLHATAKIIVRDYHGKFPETYHELISLKGIGDYTASAIASICFDQPEPVVDGNVYRVLSRYFGVDLPINSSAGIKYFKELARKLMSIDHIRDYNQGIMEFGAVQCVPKNPVCDECPLASGCVALAENRIGTLPVKNKKAAVKKRHFNYVVGLDSDNKTRIVQRNGNDIWKNLYEFPMIESVKELTDREIFSQCGEMLGVNEIDGIYENNATPLVHKLSHQHLYAKFWIVQTSEDFEEGISLDELERFPVPVLIADFIKTFKNSYF